MMQSRDKLLADYSCNNQLQAEETHTAYALAPKVPPWNYVGAKRAPHKPLEATVRLRHQIDSPVRRVVDLSRQSDGTKETRIERLELSGFAPRCPFP